MPTENLHDDAIIVDGLEISNWSREVFEDMRRGGLTAVNCTCVVWEGFREAMNRVAQWKQWFKANSDLIIPVYTTEDIRTAKAQGKTGIYLGWQNTSGIEDRLEYVQLFKDLGVGCMQLTYNTRNLVGSGCWEKHDDGLSGFGHEVVEAMNEAKVLVDLSHVGIRTSADAIAHSSVPVAYTHCAPAGLLDHPRNKTDEQLRAVVAKGGFVGFATYPPFMAQGADTTVDHCVDVLEYLVNLIGEDAVGIGTDFTQNQDAQFFDYLSHDKGYARRVVPKRPGSGVTVMPEGLRKTGEFGNLTAALQKRGWPEPRIRKVMGENWVTFLAEVWGA
ncbi:MAG: membrane dipeptidase [Gammaproteobacteria bacterium]|jgi:membrane dipeptidase